MSWCCRTDPIDFGDDPSKVNELILADCKVERIIDKIGKRKKFGSMLEFLNLIIHQFIATFVNVEKLNLSWNNLEILPDFIGNLSSSSSSSLFPSHIKCFHLIADQFPLKEMPSIHHNKLKILPEWFKKFSATEILDLSFNSFEILPEFIGNLLFIERMCRSIIG